MAAKPWESRLMEQQMRSDASEPQSSRKCEEPCASRTKPSKKFEDDHGKRFRPLEPASVNIKRNNVTTRISARPPSAVASTRCGVRSTSSPSSECRYDESSASSSSMCASTPISGTTHIASTSEMTEESNNSRPNYMSLTESIKAKQKGSSFHRSNMMKQSSGDFQTYRKMASANMGDSRSCASSDFKAPSSKLSHPVTRQDKNLLRDLEKENNSSYYGVERPASVF